MVVGTSAPDPRAAGVFPASLVKTIVLDNHCLDCGQIKPIVGTEREQRPNPIDPTQMIARGRCKDCKRDHDAKQEQETKQQLLEQRLGHRLYN